MLTTAVAIIALLAVGGAALAMVFYKKSGRRRLVRTAVAVKHVDLYTREAAEAPPRLVESRHIRQHPAVHITEQEYDIPDPRGALY